MLPLMQPVQRLAVDAGYDLDDTLQEEEQVRGYVAAAQDELAAQGREWLETWEDLELEMGREGRPK